MIWDIFWILYFLVGITVSTFANIGHKLRYGYPMHWLHLLVGVFLWPIILLVGGRK